MGHLAPVATIQLCPCDAEVATGNMVLHKQVSRGCVPVKLYLLQGVAADRTGLWVIVLFAPLLTILLPPPPKQQTVFLGEGDRVKNMS